GAPDARWRAAFLSGAWAGRATSRLRSSFSPATRAGSSPARSSTSMAGRCSVAEAPRDPAVAVLGAVLGFLGVLAGAFGAHALEGRLTPEMHAIWETAARYQLLHAVVLVFAGW